MNLQFVCPGCRKNWQCDAVHAGQPFTCTDCGQAMTLPPSPPAAVPRAIPIYPTSPVAPQLTPAAGPAAFGELHKASDLAPLPPHATATFNIFHRKRLALFPSSLRAPATMRLSLTSLHIDCERFGPVDLPRPPQKRQVKFCLGISPIENPKGKQFLAKIGGGLFQLDRPAADALAAWCPVLRPWMATNWGFRLVVGMLILQVVGCILLMVAMADGRIGLGIPLGPLVFGAMAYQSYKARGLYDRLEKQQLIADRFVTVLRKANG